MEKTKVIEIIKAAADECGIPREHLLTLAKIESGFRPAAISPTGCKGLFQFTKKTWDAMVNLYGAKYGVVGDVRMDPRANTVMAGELMRFNNRLLAKKLGRDANLAELYMAHNIGPNGTIKLIQTAESAPSTRLSTQLIGSKPQYNPLFLMSGKVPATAGEAVKRYHKHINDALNSVQSL